MSADHQLVGEGFAFFYWHRENCRLNPYGMCAYREFDSYCITYWLEGHNR